MQFFQTKLLTNNMRLDIKWVWVTKPMTARTPVLPLSKFLCFKCPKTSVTVFPTVPCVCEKVTLDCKLLWETRMMCMI